LKESLMPLEHLVVEEVDQALACAVKASPRPGAVRLTIEKARAIQEPLAHSREARKRKQPGQAELSSGEEDVAGEAGLESVLKETDKLDQASSSGSSGCSVDTDVDSGLDELLVAAKTQAAEEDAIVSDMSEPPEETGSEEDAEAEVAALQGACKTKRHPAGTWTVWQSTWFYITKPLATLISNVGCALLCETKRSGWEGGGSAVR